MQKITTTILGAALLSCASVSVMAQEPVRESKHNQPSGEGVYRIELTGIKPLKVRATGDPRSAGELHRVSIELLNYGFGSASGNQYDKYTYTGGRNFTVNEKNGQGTYASIQVGNKLGIGWGGHNLDEETLWMHNVPIYPNSAAPDGYMDIVLRVTARELDCSGDYICRRGNTGVWTVNLRIKPPMENVPNRCTDVNTFSVQPIDGKLSLINPYAVSRPEYSYSRGEWEIQKSSDGPTLAMFNAEICIARTTREPWSSAYYQRLENARRRVAAGG